MKKSLPLSFCFIFLLNICYSQTFEKKLIAYSSYDYVNNAWKFGDSFRVFCREGSSINSILYREGFSPSLVYSNLVWQDILDMQINVHDLLFRSTTYLYEFDKVDSLIYYKDSTNAPTTFFRNFKNTNLDSTNIVGRYSGWDPSKKPKLIYQYDNQNLVEVKTQVWNNSLNTYTDFWIDSFIYDPAGKIVRHQVLRIDSLSGNIEGFLQNLFSYTSFGKLLEYQKLIFNNVTNTWNQTNKYVFEYNSSNLPIEALEYNHNINQAVARYIWSYNSNNLLLSETKDAWQNGNWVNNNRKFEFTYNNNGLPLSKLRYESGQLISKHDFLYNNMDSLITIDYNIYNGNNQFSIISKTFIERDADNDVKETQTMMLPQLSHLAGMQQLIHMKGIVGDSTPTTMVLKMYLYLRMKSLNKMLLFFQIQPITT